MRSMRTSWVVSAAAAFWMVVFTGRPRWLGLTRQRPARRGAPATTPFVGPTATSSDTARPGPVKLSRGQPEVRTRRTSGRMDEELQRSQDGEPDVFGVLR